MKIHVASYLRKAATRIAVAYVDERVFINVCKFSAALPHRNAPLEISVREKLEVQYRFGDALKRFIRQKKSLFLIDFSGRFSTLSLPHNRQVPCSSQGGAGTDSQTALALNGALMSALQ
jgi:hypothetical protein